MTALSRGGVVWNSNQESNLESSTADVNHDIQQLSTSLNSTSLSTSSQAELRPFYTSLHQVQSIFTPQTPLDFLYSQLQLPFIPTSSPLNRIDNASELQKAQKAQTQTRQFGTKGQKQRRRMRILFSKCYYLIVVDGGCIFFKLPANQTLMQNNSFHCFPGTFR